MEFRSLVAAGIMLAVGAFACKGGPAETVHQGQSEPASGRMVTLAGAGATFQYPLMTKWAAEYHRTNTRVRVNYQSIGSGGGIRQLIAGTVNFGSTDGPMTDEQLAEAKTPVLHVPVTLGAVAVVTNLPGVTESLRLPGDLVAAIFLGSVTRWDDPALVAANPGIPLPATPITVVRRSDGSGTTYIFLDFLAKVSPAWRESVGVATSVNWPVGLGAKGNEGVAGQVKQTPGSIGYVELTYALQNSLPTALVRNPEGEFVAPSVESVTAAAAGASSDMPDDLRVSITNAHGTGAYPISGFSWVVLRQSHADCKVAVPMVRFLSWAVHDGQAFAAPLHYSPLPEAVVARCDAKLASVTCEGRPVL
jgi:phosphate transport system substrate-binding protein